MDSKSFWEIDSFKNTVKRAEDGMQTCSEVMKLLQERADVEKEYAKRLKVWAKKWSDVIEKGPEYGSSKSAWVGSLNEANRLADVHVAIRDQLVNVIQAEVKNWKSQNYKKQVMGGCKVVRTFESEFRKAQKPWAKRLEKVERAKKVYHNACRVEMNQENNKNAMEDQQPEHMRKALEKFDKCRKDVDVAKEKYYQTLSELGQVNAKYIEDMTAVFDQTQEFEMKRLGFIKKILYDLHKCLNISQNADVLEIYKEFHQTIDDFDSAKDTKWWSQNHGADMPMDWPKFEEYVPEVQPLTRPRRSDKTGSLTTSQTFEAPLPLQVSNNAPRHLQASAEPSLMYDNMDNDHEEVDHHISSLQQSHQSAGYQGAGVVGYNANLNGVGTSVSSSHGATQQMLSTSSGVMVRALYDYEGEEDDELSFKIGEEFMKVKDRDDQGWCMGVKDGRTGLYPDNYVEVC